MNPRDAARATFQASARWLTSSYSGGQGECVEIDSVSVPGWAGIRDSKLGQHSGVLALTESAWVAFIAGVKNGEFDV